MLGIDLHGGVWVVSALGWWWWGGVIFTTPSILADCKRNACCIATDGRRLSWLFQIRAEVFLFSLRSRNAAACSP